MEATIYEFKMTCDQAYLPDVRVWVNLHPDAFRGVYSPRRVNSLYFDTHEVDCLNDNLIGISERRKLRFRWYGDDFSRVQGALELKCKSNHLRWKKSCAIPVTFDLTTICWEALIRRLRAQAHGRFALCLSSLDQPTVITSYVREYYESMDQAIRLTIDHDLQAFEQVMYAVPNLTVQAPLSHQIVVEVKSPAGLSYRVSDVLSRFPLQVGRNSKYVNAMMSSLCFM